MAKRNWQSWWWSLIGRCPFCGGKQAIRLFSQPGRIYCPDCHASGKHEDEAIYGIKHPEVWEV